MKEFLDDLTTRDQRMMFAVLTMVHTADTKEQLDNDTEALLTTARKHLCQFAVLKYQQMDGLNTVMPYGTRKIDSFRTLTTESLAVFMPFRVQDIYDENGIYYGQNVISKNMIIADRKQLLNGNSFAVIISQSNGKWVFCKHKERDTYEVPGGHREAGEDIFETAKRELQEETGAIKFEIKPICVYSVTGKTRVNDTGEETFGLLCFAEITEFAKELHSEMEKVVLMDELPENWTYPLIQPKLIEKYLQVKIIL